MRKLFYLQRDRPPPSNRELLGLTLLLVAVGAGYLLVASIPV